MTQPYSNNKKSASMEQKKKEDKGFFTQLPIILFDKYADKMPATSFVAFTKFYRHYGYKGAFKGSIRKLCNVLKIARGSIHRAIKDWVDCGLVRKEAQRKVDENRDEMVLLIEGETLWKENIEHSRSLQGSPNLGQSVPIDTPPVPENENGVPIWDNSVPETSHLVPERDNSVPDLSHFVPAASSKCPPYITEDSSNITLDKIEERDASPRMLSGDGSFIPSDSSLSFSNQQESPDHGGGSIFSDQGRESQLLQWINELRVPRGKDPQKFNADIALLGERITSYEQLKTLYAHVRAKYDGVVWLGNLATEVDAWLQTRTTEESPQNAEEAKCGLSWQQCQELYSNILEYYPELNESIYLDESNAPTYFMGIALGNDRWIDIANVDNWYYVNPKLVQQALLYSRKQKATKRREEATHDNTHAVAIMG